MYPFANTVGCCCGWVASKVDPDDMEERFRLHLEEVARRDR
jgi:hypothetical protein